MYKLLVILFLIKLYARINVYLMDFYSWFTLLSVFTSLYVSIYFQLLQTHKHNTYTHKHISFDFVQNLES